MVSVAFWLGHSDLHTTLAGSPWPQCFHPFGVPVYQESRVLTEMTSGRLVGFFLQKGLIRSSVGIFSPKGTNLATAIKDQR